MPPRFREAATQLFFLDKNMTIPATKKQHEFLAILEGINLRLSLIQKAADRGEIDEVDIQLKSLRKSIKEEMK